MATALSLIREADNLIPVNGDYESYCKAKINILTNAIELEPNNSTAYYNRGFSHYALKNYTQAISDFTKAIEFDPEDDEPYRGRGTVYNDIGEYEKAIDDLTKAVELNFLWKRRGYWTSGSGYCYDELGKAYYNLKDYERAEDYFTKAIEESGFDYDAYYGRGLIYYDLGNYERALADFNKAFDFGFTNNPWSDKSWGEKFVADYKDKWALFHQKRGATHYKLKNYVDAVADFSKAIEYNPDNAEFYDIRGRAYVALGETDKASADFSKAENLGYIPK